MGGDGQIRSGGLPVSPYHHFLQAIPMLWLLSMRLI